jgi:hypothetical protein
MTTSTEQEKMTAWVARHQQGGRLRAEYRFSDLTQLRWDDSSGGTRARTNQYYIHGYVYCDAMLRGVLITPACTDRRRTG